MNIVYTVLLILSRGNQPGSAYTIPYYIWPLAAVRPDLETTGHASTSSGNCSMSDTTHPSLDYSSLQFQGNTMSFKEFSLDETVVSFYDFTFSLFVSPIGDEGTFFHFQKHNLPSGTDKIKEIVLFYKHNTVFLHVFGSDSTDALVNISTQSFFQIGEWKPVTAQYEHGKEFVLWAGPIEVRFDFRTEICLGQPGRVRVGGSFLPNYSPYNGRATCLQFYDTKLGGSSFEKALQNCLSATWTYNMTGSIDSQCNTCEDMNGYYQLVAREMLPLSSPTYGFTTCSKVRCANRCALQGSTCVSFAIKRSRSTYICKLYDLNGSESMLPDSGWDYYVSRTEFNCC